jgi:hypothetical protein
LTGSIYQVLVLNVYMPFCMSRECVGKLMIDLLFYPLFLLPKKALNTIEILTNLYFCNTLYILDVINDN